MGFRVFGFSGLWGSGCGIQGLIARVLWFGVWGLGFLGLVFCLWGSGFEVQGLIFAVRRGRPSERPPHCWQHIEPKFSSLGSPPASPNLKPDARNPKPEAKP